MCRRKNGNYVGYAQMPGCPLCSIHRCKNEGYGLIQIFTEKIRISPFPPRNCGGPRPFTDLACNRHLQQSSGFLERLPPDGVTSFKSHGKGAEINIFA